MSATRPSPRALGSPQLSCSSSAWVPTSACPSGAGLSRAPDAHPPPPPCPGHSAASRPHAGGSHVAGAAPCSVGDPCHLTAAGASLPWAPPHPPLNLGPIF